MPSSPDIDRRTFLKVAVAAPFGVAAAANEVVFGPLPAHAEAAPAAVPAIPLDELLDESTIETTSSGVLYKKTILHAGAERFSPSGQGRSPLNEVGPVLASPQALLTSEQGGLFMDVAHSNASTGLVVASASVLELETHDRYMVGLDMNKDRAIAKLWLGSINNMADQRPLGKVSADSSRHGFVFLDGGRSIVVVNGQGEAVGEPFRLERPVLEPGEAAQIAMWKAKGSTASLGTMMSVDIQDLGGLQRPQAPQG